MSRTRMTARWMSATAALALSATVARADPQYDLRTHLEVDQQWSFQQTSTMSMSVQVGAAGGQPMTQSGGQKRTATITVLAVKDGLPTSLKIAFGADCGQSAGQNGQSREQAFPLAGKTVRVRKDDLGIVVVDGADTDPATTNELTAMLTPDRSLYPSHPVAVGDAWDGDAAAVGKQLGFGPNDSVTAKCRLTRIGSVDGRPVAEIAVSIAGTKTEDGVTRKITLDGTAQDDVATGQTLQGDLTGTMDLSGQANSPQGPQAVSGTGKVEMHQSLRPVTGVAAVAAAPAPSPIVTNPLANGGAVNPLGGDVVDKFAGTYKNDRISVQLQPAANGYAGTIAMGDRKFPAVAHPDGDRLVGTFESGGNKFDFTATVTGTTLQMASGQNTFTLQKDAPANPLDALGGGSAPVNPLAPR